MTDQGPPRTPGSFHALAERLLRDGYPEPLTDAGRQQLADAAVTRVRRSAGTRPQPPIPVIRQGTPRLGPGYDLSGADLEGADLPVAYLRGAVLRGAHLRGANLRRADLRAADLREADLHDATLRGANLNRADLGRANLSRADLTEAYLWEADLGGANLMAANLGKADLRAANLSDADLSRADLSQANLAGAVWDRETAWPADLAAWAAGNSDPLPGGGYRIRPGRPPAPAAVLRKPV